METFIIYILKTGICLGVFLIIYSLLLRPTTFFRFNRLFLLFGFVASLVIPFVKYTYEVVIQAPFLSETIQIGSVQPAPLSFLQFNIWIILSGLYVAGALLFIFRNLYAYIKIYRLVKSGVQYENKGFKLIESTRVSSPFTVLNYILVNTGRLSQVEKDLIMKHEITHVSQKHWVDLLCSDCMLILQWFNPMAWVYVRFLKENHEFLADKAVIDSGVSPALYQAVLINQKFQGSVFSFSNSFNYSKSLNRLSMIKKTKSSPWKKFFVLIVIPVFGLFVWASAEPEFVFEQSNVMEVPDDSIADAGHISVQSQDILPETRPVRTRKLKEKGTDTKINSGDSSGLRIKRIPGIIIKDSVVIIGQKEYPLKEIKNDTLLKVVETVRLNSY